VKHRAPASGGSRAPVAGSVRTHVSSHYGFRQLSPRRKAALAFAALYCVIFVAWVLPEVLRTPPQNWLPVPVVVIVVCGAFSTAAVVIEMVRSTVLSTSGWSDEKHFRVVMLTFGVLFVIQLTGALVGLSSFR